MSRQEVDLDADLWFIATRDSPEIAHIRANPSVGVTITTQSSWVSIAGTAEVVDDLAKLKELWSTFAEAWLPEGPEDPNAILISFAKSKVTGQPYDGGDSKIVTDL
jgi:general stress protein 26